MLRLEKDVTIHTRTTTSSSLEASDSASDSSITGLRTGSSSTKTDADATAKSLSSYACRFHQTQNEVVGENKRDFWQELCALNWALKRGPNAFRYQFGSSSWKVKLAAVLLALLLLIGTVVAVVFNIKYAQQQDDESLHPSSQLNNDYYSNLQLPLSSIPSDFPSLVPSFLPSGASSAVPSFPPSSTSQPTTHPTHRPTPLPTLNPSPDAPTPPPTKVHVTYVPGKLTRRENGLLLSEGLKSRLVARTGSRVVLNNGEKSTRAFHDQPDGAAVFEDPDTGGWVYVSNSEVKERGQGGVGGIYFDRHARTIDYRMIQQGGSTANCSGGKTPWNTWVTCEETENGRVLQVDPFGKRGMQETSMDRGFFEAFAYDIRDPNHPRFFVTEDKERGPIRRFSPSHIDWEDPWELLHAPGTLEYLVIEPRGGNRGTFRWTTDKMYAKANAAMYYPYTEGIDVWRHQLFFTTKERRELYILHLDNKTFEKESTASGIFDGMPDQVKRIVDDGLLYFCEEGGVENGVHARDENGWFFTILETDTFSDESTGLAFSPDGKRMYVAFQHSGRIFDIWREDGLPFHGKTLSVRYHEFRQR